MLCAGANCSAVLPTGAACTPVPNLCGDGGAVFPSAADWVAGKVLLGVVRDEGDACVPVLDCTEVPDRSGVAPVCAITDKNKTDRVVTKIDLVFINGFILFEKIFVFNRNLILSQVFAAWF